MIILAINEDHNATAALVKDGKVLYCASEERITRSKNDIGYPFQTIAEALKETNIKPNQIDYIVYTGHSLNPVDLKIKRTTRFSIPDYIQEMDEYWKPVLIEKKPSSFWDKMIKKSRFNNPDTEYYNFDFLKTIPKEKWEKAFNKERVNVVVKQLGIDPKKVLFVNHHKCHAYYAYYASPIDRAKKTAVVTADSWGDGENASIWLAENGKLKKIHGTALCNLARIYRFMTLLLGMKPNEHEYKVMGLAPYAKDYIMQPAYDVFKKTLKVNGLDFKWNKKPSDMYFYFKEKLEGIRFDGIAAGLQKWLEDMVVEWITNILKHLKVDSLVYSGGLSQNVKANKSISKIPQLKNLFVPPSGGDESTAIGAAYIVSIDQGIIPQPLQHAYLGYSITDDEIEKLLQKYKVEKKYKVLRNATNKEIVDLLATNKVVARCVGAMEFGARALGNRSILCNPANFDNIRLINEKIKFRDFWMPFTPTILDHRAKDYLVNPKNLKVPYMTIAFDTTPLCEKHLKAAVHPYDFTARPQVLKKEVNLEYYELIQAFEKKAGIGAVLNTSLNLHGEPIVRNAEDAWHTFIHSGLDALLLNKTLIIKD